MARLLASLAPSGATIKARLNEDDVIDQLILMNEDHHTVSETGVDWLENLG